MWMDAADERVLSFAWNHATEGPYTPGTYNSCCFSHHMLKNAQE